MQHLSPAASVSWTDDAGWHLRGVSPFPGSTLLAAETGGMMDLQSAALMAGFMAPLRRARMDAEQAQRAQEPEPAPAAPAAPPAPPAAPRRPARPAGPR
jgi:hypothetical protein